MYCCMLVCATMLVVSLSVARPSPCVSLYIDWLLCCCSCCTAWLLSLVTTWALLLRTCGVPVNTSLLHWKFPTVTMRIWTGWKHPSLRSTTTCSIQRLIGLHMICTCRHIIGCVSSISGSRKSSTLALAQNWSVWPRSWIKSGRNCWKRGRRSCSAS